eukprot:1571918-Prorocentrum_lima.AAC.1
MASKHIQRCPPGCSTELLLCVAAKAHQNPYVVYHQRVLHRWAKAVHQGAPCPTVLRTVLDAAALR